MSEAKDDLKFNALWNKFDTVYLRETQGRHDLKTFRHFLEERAKIEETYAHSLQKLQAKEKDFEAAGCHGKCWADFRSATKTLADQHLELATKLNKEIGSALDEKVKSLKVGKEKMMAEHKTLEKELAKRQSNHDKAQARYRDAVKAAETAVINKETGSKENLPAPKQQALENKVKTAFDKVDSSQQEYRSAVHELKACQEQWDAKLREHLDAFEGLERDRLNCLTEQFTRVSEGHSTLSSAVSQLVIFLENGIKEIAAEADIHAFITQHLPDGQPPPHVTYEEISSEILTHARGGAPTSSVFMARNESRDGGVGFVPSNPQAPKANEIKLAQAPGGPKLATADTAQSFPDVSKRHSSLGQFAIALYDFDAAEDSDLPFKANDRIRIIDSSDKDWWRGEVGGRQGMFPSNYVKMQEDAGAAAADEQQQQPRQMDAKAQAIYDFVGQGSDELSFKEGEILYITGELNQWFLGKSADGSRVGIFPSNYVKII